MWFVWLAAADVFGSKFRPGVLDEKGGLVVEDLRDLVERLPDRAPYSPIEPRSTWHRLLVPGTNVLEIVLANTLANHCRHLPSPYLRMQKPGGEIVGVKFWASKG